jgi:hypothetical protein
MIKKQDQDFNSQLKAFTQKLQLSRKEESQLDELIRFREKQITERNRELIKNKGNLEPLQKALISELLRA